MRALQAAAPAARRESSEELPEGWKRLLDPQDLQRLAERARSLASIDAPGITGADVRGGLAVLLLVFFSTLPVALPFLLFGDLYRAARVSDATGLVMLFVIGTRLGRHAGRHPMLVGLIMVGIGVVLSAIAIRLGG
jgi:VIT1/CCC1 family predicted Fe2+/Mn2+ transporter